MKRLFISLGACVVLLLLINLLVGAVASDEWAVDAASGRCREEGWQPSELVLARSKISGGLFEFGKRAVVEFRSKGGGQPKLVRVTLRKPVNLAAWRVVGYEDGGEGGGTPGEVGNKDDSADPLVEEARADTEAVLNGLLAGKYDEDRDFAPVARKVKGYESWSIDRQEIDRDSPRAVNFHGTLKGPKGEAMFVAGMRKQRNGKWMIGYFSGPRFK